MKKILGLVVLSLFAISASAADLMASSTAPTVTQNIVVEGAACPGVGATGFSSTGLLLSCQSGVWLRDGHYGGSYQWTNSGCVNVPNPLTGTYGCPTGYLAFLTGSAMGLNICGGGNDQTFVMTCIR
ncbi:hypothetical protein [Pseudomonas aeruginosa]|uniref:hypothetical protein n=1 Tax=Pseudomonas aeruginosa TaxID=287 RepID=UPI001114B882|nr:hypothetical protein [Pseudomonas aeruginosa]